MVSMMGVAHACQELSQQKLNSALYAQGQHLIQHSRVSVQPVAVIAGSTMQVHWTFAQELYDGSLSWAVGGQQVGSSSWMQEELPSDVKRWMQGHDQKDKPTGPSKWSEADPEEAPGPSKMAEEEDPGPRSASQRQCQQRRAWMPILKKKKSCHRIGAGSESGTRSMPHGIGTTAIIPSRG